MSLFERIQNKRYDLQEKKKFSPKGQGELFPDPWESGNSSNNTSTSTETPPKSGPRKIKKKLSTTGRGFDDVTGEGNVKYPKTRAELEIKRKEYGIDSKGNISDDGVKRYAQKTKQLSSGSNLPVKPTKKELDIAKTRAVGGKPVLSKGTKGVKDKVIGTTTGKYGGKLNPLATKAELDATKAAIKSSKTVSAKANVILPKVYQKGKGFKNIIKKLPRKTRVIDTPTRRVQLIKPPKIKTIPKAPPIISDPIKTTNPLKTLTKTELEKLTAPKGFVKTKTGSFTKTKPLFKNVTKRLSKMGTKGKVAAGLLALTGIGVGLSKTGQKQDKKKLLVPPTTSNAKKPLDFSISLGPGK